MINVNIVFDNIFDDADIIAVPDEIAEKIEEIEKEFLDWVHKTDDADYWITINGRKCNVVETDGFIKWLNSCYCKGIDKAYIVERNTNYNSKFKIIEF